MDRVLHLAMSGPCVILKYLNLRGDHAVRILLPASSTMISLRLAAERHHDRNFGKARMAYTEHCYRRDTGFGFCTGHGVQWR